MTVLVVGSIVVGAYVLGLPLLLRHLYRQLAEPAVREIAVTDLPPRIDEELARLMAAPVGAGFSLQLVSEIATHRGSTGYCVQLGSSGTTIVEILVVLSGERLETAVSCGTTVRRPDSLVEVATMDSLLSSGLVVPEMDLLRLPGLSFADLLAVHEHRVAERTGADGVAEHPECSRDALLADLRRAPAIGLASGYLRPAQKGLLRLTVYGAYRLGWPQMWPASAVTRSRLLRQAARVVAELDAVPPSTAPANHPPVNN